MLSNRTDATLVFTNGSEKETRNIPLKKIRKGADEVKAFINSQEGTQIFVADAVTDDDLEIICKASASLLRPHVLAGSAGLANQLAHSLGKAGTVPPEKPAALSPVLIIAGTRQAETAAQINTLCETFPDAALVRFEVAVAADGKAENAIAKAFDEASRSMKENPCSCVVAVDSMFCPSTDVYAEGDETNAVICEALGVLAEKLMDSFRFPMLLTTGGDTTLAVCRRLGVNAIEPLAEISPGIPLGRIAGGNYNGRFIVTKSGRFGNADSLVDIFNWSVR
jgi:uncharacterized protein YgbK (DUF1537 family)